MLHTNFDSSIVTDFAPHGSLCEWCGKPAVQQLTAIGGPNHNEGGFFCSSCGEEFARAVAESLRDGAVSEANTIKPVSR
ncbi:MAG: hypothetical protein ACJ8CB_31600 [Ktedonobacteraceae bacterium]